MCARIPCFNIGMHICNEDMQEYEDVLQENLAGKLCGNIGNEGAGIICNEDMQEYEDVLRENLAGKLCSNIGNEGDCEVLAVQEALASKMG